jgi:hypothetical protein
MEKREFPVVSADHPHAGPLAQTPEPDGLGRRQVLQGLLAGVGAAIPGVSAPPPPVASHHVAQAAAAKAKAPDWSPEFLDAHQFATLGLLCEQLVPGSTKVQSDRFMDAVLAVDTRENKQRFLSALGAMDAEAGRRFGKPFRSLPAAAQLEILTAAASGPPGKEDWVWVPGTPVVRPEEGESETTLRDHFEQLKKWVVGAYYSSETGLKELGYTGNQFFATFPDCDHEGGHAG